MAEVADRLDAVDWSALARRLGGIVVRPGDDRMVLAGKQFAAGKPLAVPQALIRCRGIEDVRTSLDFLRKRHIGFAVRSGGHCLADLSSSGSVVLDVEDMRAIEPGHESIRVGPGASSADVSRVLASHGRVLPTAASPWIALGGASVTGGYGHLGRLHGLTADHVESMQVVTADGRVLETTAENEPDLFWALRGAGAAGFGIVTAITLRTFRLDGLTACHGVWPMKEAVSLIDRWQHWAPEAHPGISLALGLVGPEDPDYTCRIELAGAIHGTASEARDRLAEVIRFLGTNARHLRIRTLPGATAADYLVGLLDQHAERAWQPSRPYRDTGYQFARSDFFEEPLGIDAIGDCVARFQADRCYPQFRCVEFVPWAGAYARDNPSACFRHRSPRMLIKQTAIVGARSSRTLRENGRLWVDAAHATLQRHASGHVYQGYADLYLDDWSHAYYGDTYPRLQRIKRRYDPDQFFRHVQSVVPDGSSR